MVNITKEELPIEETLRKNLYVSFQKLHRQLSMET